MNFEEFKDLDDKQFDRMIRVSELEIKNLELKLKERDFSRSNRLNPVTLGVLAAAIGLLGNVAVSFVNAGSSLQQTIRTNTQQLELERKKAEGALILDAMKPIDINDRCQNLFLLEGLGFTDVSVRITAVCKMASIYNSLEKAEASKGLGTGGGQIKPLQPHANHGGWWDSVIVIWFSRIGGVFLFVWLTFGFIYLIKIVWKAIR